MPFEHHFTAALVWPRVAGASTASPDFSRDFTISLEGKPDILGSGPTAFKGNAAGQNPEEMLVASLSACHMLTYLSLAARKGLAVTGYEDHATGKLERGAGGKIQFTQVTLRPKVSLAPGADSALAQALHHDAHAGCFVGNSVNFPVQVAPVADVG
ncbi:MAG: OsmC family protein [Burkholderiales bacterium]